MSPSSPAPARVAVFTSHPIQYQAPLFRELASRPELEPTVFFGSRHGLDDSFDSGFGASFRWDLPLLDGYRSVFLENEAGKPDVSSFRGVDVPSIDRFWTRGAFDACLVLGWQTRGHLQALRAARRSGLPLLLRGESTLEARPASVMRAALRSLLWLPVRAAVYRRRFAGAAAILPIGTRNRRYYASFGVPDARMFEAKYCVENERFALAGTERETARRRVRSTLGLDADAVLFVSAAKLIARKRPLDVLAAFAKLTLERPELRVALLFLGDGPERPRLEEAIAAEGLGDRVRISGFVNQSEIPAWYAASDCLVLPSDSQETWGLVVNEAMAAGLPVIVSDAVGCSPDLVEEGGNGFTFPFADTPALADRMSQVATLAPERRAELGARSREIVAGCTFAAVADRVVEALAMVRGER